MDDARARSAERDALRKKRAEQLSSDLGRGPIPRPRKGRKSKLCPECRYSVAHLRWDSYRGLWVHEACGFTATEEEYEDLADE